MSEQERRAQIDRSAARSIELTGGVSLTRWERAEVELWTGELLSSIPAGACLAPEGRRNAGEQTARCPIHEPPPGVTSTGMRLLESLLWSGDLT